MHFSGQDTLEEAKWVDGKMSLKVHEIFSVKMMFTIYAFWMRHRMPMLIGLSLVALLLGTPSIAIGSLFGWVMFNLYVNKSLPKSVKP